MSLPPHYAIEADESVSDFLISSYGRTFADDVAELDKITPIANAYKRICKVTDVEGLQGCTNAQHVAALAMCVDEAEVEGIRKYILKFLGSKGSVHVPPSAAGAQTVPDSASMASGSAAKPSIRFGRLGAGGHSNEANFKEAIRQVAISAAEIRFSADLHALIDAEVAILPQKGGKRCLQSIIWDCADWSINEFGVQPAVSCPNFFNAVASIIKSKLPGKWKDFPIASMLYARTGEYKRGGAKGQVVRVGLNEEQLNSPLRVLLNAGKIELVPR